jgi:ATP-binding cassette subfamily F protein uup
VRALSGGEKARLMMARLLAKPSNLLVLDEPTNDLDVETLDLLQEVLDDYDGTVILVSHDRDFVDRVASTTIAMEGDGRAVIYAGGWSDYQDQKPKSTKATTAPDRAKAPSTPPAPVKAAAVAPASRLSFTEAHRLKALPGEMEKLEAEIARLEGFLADPDLFSREPQKFAKASAGLVERQEKLAAAEEEWLELEDRAAAG